MRLLVLSLGAPPSARPAAAEATAPLAEEIRRARAAGFTHVLVVDAAKPWDASIVDDFLRAVPQRPDALWVCVEGARGPGRLCGRALLRVETGAHVAGAGAVSYPVGTMAPLALSSRGRGQSRELLVKAIWSGLDVLEVAANGPRPRLSLAAIRFHVKTVLVRLALPAPFLAAISLGRFRDLPRRARLREALLELFVREPGPPRRIALSAGLGVFMGLAPIWGLQLTGAVLGAHVTRLSKPIAAVASHVSVPFLIPPILYASLVVGRILTGAPTAGVASTDLAPADLGAWIVGSLAVASCGGVVAAACVYLLVRTWVRLRRPAAAS